MVIGSKILDEILEAMGQHKALAHVLIGKLIAETDQPATAEIEAGNYYEIVDADILNGNENLTDHWWFDVHGEHCMFKNLITNQVLEVSLGDKESIGNLDPYFFYNFLQTTDSVKHLIKYFDNPFSDMLNLFEELERQNKMVHIGGVQFRLR
ncbi:hypothetical protein D7322_25400 [Sphingobacterium puteale]|uniref:DUF6896 domain-containing protein n=1 Tax=Sphingobacterium puteale TaxID=2420510 RepID=A0A420VR19_9SPHI|nr:hypothetical protein [Sphingobacterium puteale]RKO68735.1 hypothetical protein D7322_25400 [Sphingobacterium puteale]